MRARAAIAPCASGSPCTFGRKFGLRETGFNCEGGRLTSRWRARRSRAPANAIGREKAAKELTKASKAQELFEEEVKRLVKLIDVKLTLQGLRNVVEYEEALKSALASSASGTYGGMLVDVYVGVVSGSSPEAVKLGYEHVRRKLRAGWPHVGSRTRRVATAAI